MEKIVKQKWNMFLALLMLSNLLIAQTSILEKIENECNGSKLIHYYLEETPNDNDLIFSLDEMKINKTQCRLNFFSEVDDEFTIYVNGDVYKKENVNTIPSVKEDGVARGRAILFKIDYPQGDDKFILRVESNKYGCFETEARKEHPMLYIKYLDNTWYLSHTNVFWLPTGHFMNTTTKF